MLRLLGSLGIGGILLTSPIWGGYALGVAALAAPFYYIDRHTVHLIAEDPNLMTIEPVSVQWGGGGKTMTLRVTNNTDDTWSRFAIWCYTDRGALSSAEATDMSGLLPHQTDVRTYKIMGGKGGETSTITKVNSCEITSHMRGKPSAFNVRGDFEREGGGGWGDRVGPNAPTGDPMDQKMIVDTGDGTLTSGSTSTMSDALPGTSAAAMDSDDGNTDTN